MHRSCIARTIPICTSFKLSSSRGFLYLFLTAQPVWHIAVTAANRMPGGWTQSGAYLRAMPIVIIALGLVNLLLAAGLLWLDWKRAAVLGSAMGLLTAPWAVVLF